MMQYVYLGVAGLIVYGQFEARPEPFTATRLLVIGALLLLSEIAAWRTAYQEKPDAQ